jgi:hypothetical protein
MTRYCKGVEDVPEICNSNQQISMKNVVLGCKFPEIVEFLGNYL